MKKFNIIFILLAIIILPLRVNARSDTITVTLNKCIDGDTASFNYNSEVYKVRFLAVNTMELKSDDPYADIAAEYTCNRLTEAQTIKLKFDKGSDEKDKYDRYLAWVFVDDNLLQEELIEKGYAEVKYIYGTYEYTEELQELESVAKADKLGIWSDYESDEDDTTSTKDYSEYIYIGATIVCILLGISTTKIKKVKKIIKQLK
jgi:micrococcal nuclease